VHQSVRKINSDMKRNRSSSDGTLTCCECVIGIPFPAVEKTFFSSHYSHLSQPASCPVGTLTVGSVNVTRQRKICYVTCVRQVVC